MKTTEIRCGHCGYIEKDEQEIKRVSRLVGGVSKEFGESWGTSECPKCLVCEVKKFIIKK